VVVKPVLEELKMTPLEEFKRELLTQVKYANYESKVYKPIEIKKVKNPE